MMRTPAKANTDLSAATIMIARNSSNMVRRRGHELAGRLAMAPPPDENGSGLATQVILSQVHPEAGGKARILSLKS